MLAANFKRTKIVASLGPSTHSHDAIEDVVKAGANCVRLNLSHGSHEEHTQRLKWARSVAEKLDKPVSVLMDLQGPKFRFGELPEEGIVLKPGDQIKLGYHAKYDETGIIPIQYDFSKKLKAYEVIFMYDGRLQAVVEKVHDGIIHAKVKVGGTLISRKGINLPDTDFSGDILTVKDISDIAFAAKSQVDFVALSFVQRAEDVLDLKRRLKRHGSDALVVAKIETKLAVQNLESIVEAADAIMVARGDLAVELPPEVVPVVQRTIVELGQKMQKPVIVATQMLQSMVSSPTPTRAEVSDVATAVMQGADAVMLSEETNMGQYPTESVAMMKRIIVHTQTFAPPQVRIANPQDHSQQNAVSAAAITLARQVEAKVIIAETASGQTARNIASFRPPMPVIMVTSNRRTYQQLPIVWGGKSYLRKSPKSASNEVMDLLKKAGNVHKGDHVVVVSGHQAGVAGGTDRLQVHVIK